MNYRKLHDRIVDSVAQSLHYFEKQSEIDLTKSTANDITNMCEGGIPRYMNEPIFRAKVQSMVAAILGAVRECDAVGPPTEGGRG